MPRTKKATVIAKTEIQSIISQEEEFSVLTPIYTSDNKEILKNEKSTEKVNTDISLEIQEPLTKIPKDKFKQLHIKDNYWLENDIYQTIADMTAGKKDAKALIINQALKDYLKKNNMEIKPLRVKGKKD